MDYIFLGLESCFLQILKKCVKFKSFLLKVSSLPSEASIRGVLNKKVKLLKISQSSREDTCARVSFFRGNRLLIRLILEATFEGNFHRLVAHSNKSVSVVKGRGCKDNNIHPLSVTFCVWTLYPKFFHVMSCMESLHWLSFRVCSSLSISLRVI